MFWYSILFSRWLLYLQNAHIRSDILLLLPGIAESHGFLYPAGGLRHIFSHAPLVAKLLAVPPQPPNRKRTQLPAAASKW